MASKKGNDNEEDIVTCPIEGCDETAVARGLFMHIYQTRGKGHAGRREFPDSIDKDEITVAGKKELEIDYPDSVDLDDTKYVDPYTGKVYDGRRGLMIHLGQAAGRGVVPDNISDEFVADDFPIVETNSEGDIVQLISRGSPELPSVDRYLPWTDPTDEPVSRERIKDFIEELRNGSGAASADRIEERLLGNS